MLALASFNSHGTHFSGPYQFDNGNQIVTGCVGFGLHRWLAAGLLAVEHSIGLAPVEVIAPRLAAASAAEAS